MKKVVILTGAGISAESGIQTFRGADGLWENHRIEEVATPEAFLENPKLVQRFYNLRRKQLLSPEIKENLAHKALARWQSMSDWSVKIVTQNIDNLHERAGSEDVIHMHGELLKVICQECDQFHEWHDDLLCETKCPACAKQSLRPHIVWFGEMPLQMQEIYKLLGECDYFIAIGTSSQVYPAAMFVQEARKYGAHCIEVNLEGTQMSSFFHETLYGKASATVSQLIQQLTKRP